MNFFSNWLKKENKTHKKVKQKEALTVNKQKKCLGAKQLKMTKEFLNKSDVTVTTIVNALMQGEMQFIKQIDFKRVEHTNYTAGIQLIELFAGDHFQEKNVKIDKAKLVIDIVALKIVLADYELFCFFEPKLAGEITATYAKWYLAMLKNIHPTYFDNYDEDKFFAKVNETLDWWKNLRYWHVFNQKPDLINKSIEKFNSEMYKKFCEKLFGKIIMDILAQMAFMAMVTQSLTGSANFCRALSKELIENN